MKLIHKFKSLNYDKRKNKKISYIIIHYTALPNIEDSLEYLCNKTNKVSCHYLICQRENYTILLMKNIELGMLVNLTVFTGRYECISISGIRF